MKARRGFTLLEVMLAIVLTSVVALLVYGVLQIGIDTQQRIDERRRADEGVRAARVILIDALRNMRPSAGVDDSAFVLRTGTDRRGRPMDAVSFVSAAAIPPLTADFDWTVTLTPNDSGVSIWARAIGARLPPRLVAHLPSVRGLEVRVVGPGDDGRWTAEWPVPSVIPRAVRLVFWGDSAAVVPAIETTLAIGDTR